MNHKETAKNILNLVGGESNINDSMHCITRLRLNLKDESLAKTEDIKNLDGVIDVVKSNGHYQIILGNEVEKVYKEFAELTGNEDDNGYQVKEEKSLNPFQSFFRTLTGTITPVIGFMCAAGVLKGILSIFTTFELLSPESGTYILLNSLGDSLFYFFPIILGFSAGKKFNTNPFIPAIIGGALVHPSIVALVGNSNVTFAGIPVVLINYTFSVFPIIVAAYLSSHVERFLKEKVPSYMQTIIIPLITTVVVGILTFLLVGPAVTWVGKAIADVLLSIYSFSPIITGFIIGALWQIMVVFGLHWGLIPFVVNNVLTNGQDPLMAMLCVSILGQIGASLGVALATKDSKLKSLATTSTISALFGVTEPTLYGITLKYRKVMIFSALGAGLAGALVGLTGATYFGLAGGIFGALSSINPAGIDFNFYVYWATFAIAVFGPAILIRIFGYENKKA